MAFIINPNRFLFVYIEKKLNTAGKKKITLLHHLFKTHFMRGEEFCYYSCSKILLFFVAKIHLLPAHKMDPPFCHLKTITRKNENWIRINRSKYRTLLSCVNWNYAFKSTVGVCYRGIIVCQYFKKNRVGGSSCWRKWFINDLKYSTRNYYKQTIVEFYLIVYLFLM